MLYRLLHYFIVSVLFLFVDLFTYANCDEFKFCTPNTKDQTIFKVSHSVLTEAFHRLGHRFSLISYPAKRCPIEVDKGNVSGDSHRIFSFNADKRYAHLIRVEAVIQSIDQSIFTKNAQIQFDGWKSLCQHKIVYLSGIKVIENGLKKANVPNENIFPVFSHEQAFKLLSRNRVDLLIVNSNTGNHFLNKLSLLDSGIRLIKPPLVKFDLFPYMHKKHKEIAKKLAVVINDMKVDGSYQKILNSCH